MIDSNRRRSVGNESDMKDEFTTLDDLRRGRLISQGLRAVNGYELVESIKPGFRGKATDPVEGPWIVEKILPGEECLATWTLILRPGDEEESAHEQFIKLRGPREILRFTNRFGHLGLKDGPPRELKGRLLTRHHLYPLIPAENFQRWEVEIARMASLRSIWKHLQQGGRGEIRLRDFICWVPGRAGVHIEYGWILDGVAHDRLVSTKGHEYDGTLFPDVGLDREGRRIALFSESLATREDVQEGGELSDWTPFDASAPARSHIFTELNKQCGDVPPHLAIDGQLGLRPPTLLATLYLLFMVEVARWEPERKRCPGCLRYFSLGKGDRSDKKYCEPKCRGKRFDRENRSKAAREQRVEM